MSNRQMLLIAALEAFDKMDSDILRNYVNGHFDAGIDWLFDDFQAHNKLSDNQVKSIKKLVKSMREAVGREVAREGVELGIAENSALSALDRVLDGRDECIKEYEPYSIVELLIESGITPPVKEDVLEAYYAYNAVSGIAALVERAQQLGHVGTFIIPNESVCLAFKDAHDSYLQGLSAPCVVMLRAILEFALKKIVGPNQAHENQTMDSLIDGAIEMGVFDIAMAARARQVKKYANHAIHERGRFQAALSWDEDLITTLLLDTRAVIEALYGQPRIHPV